MARVIQRFIFGALSFLIGAIVLSVVFGILKSTAGLQIALDGYLLPILFGGVFGLIVGLWGLRLKTHQKKHQRFNLILSAIRHVDQLLVHEKDRAHLLTGICESLVKNRGYHNAWIAIFNESGELVASAEADVGKKFKSMIEWLKKGQMIPCGQRALKQAAIIITENPFNDCKDCPLSENYINRGAITVRLEHKEKIYGILTVSIPEDFISDLNEHNLLQEIAGDIGYALYGIELEEKEIQSQAQQQKTIHDLAERVKELNCLFEISRLVEKRRLSIEEILQGIVEFIPPACQYPDITCAKITIEDQEFKTGNFKETNWKLGQNIIVNKKKAGTLVVYYLEEKPERDEGPFLKEERDLIDAISERVGSIIERRKAQTALVESEKRFRDLVENSLTGISIIQDGQIVYQNPEQESLLGPLPRPIKFKDTESIHPDDVEKLNAFYQNISARNFPIGATEFRFYPFDEKANRGNMKWVHCQASLIEYQGRDAILVNMMDMTKAKELEHLLKTQDKMASLGRVAAGIAHEIRNPLSGINIYLNTLKKLHHQDGSEEKVEQILKQLQSASTKIESVIRRVMDFAKPSEPKLVLTDINEPITDAINLTAVTMRKSGIILEKKLADDLPPSYVDPNLIEEIILNLLNNAAEAMKTMETGKKIVVSSSMKGEHFILLVSDSGPGVPLNIREKIFDPYFTTKSEGTGIGLSLSHRIITDHTGSLTVSESELGGAEFRIEIPIKKYK